MSGVETAATASRRRTVRWFRLVFVACLAATPSALIDPASVGAAPAANLALQGFADLVADEANDHIFLSQGVGQDGVVVTDLAGVRITTITNLPDAGRMALSYDGTKLFVPLSESHQIAVVSPSTLTVVDRYTLSTDVCPTSVAPTANGMLAVGTRCSGLGGTGVLNLATRTFNRATGSSPTYQPVVAASVGSGELFVAADLSGGPTTLYVFASAGGTPALLASRTLNASNLRSLAVNPAGTRVVVASGAPYVHRSYSLPQLADGTDYISTNYPNSVAWSADGSTVITGTDSIYGIDLRFNDAATGAIRREVELGYLAPNGIDVSSDGRTAYAVTAASYPNGSPFELHVVGPVTPPPIAYQLDRPAPPDAPTLFNPLVPARLLDTRPSESTVDGLGRPGRPLGAASTMNVQVLGRGGVPSSGVSSVVLNVTVTSPSSSSFLTIWPSGEPQPSASNLNFVAGQTVPNLVVAKVGVAGNISIFNLSGSVDVIADVAGYFPDGDGFVPLVPARLLETRPGLPTFDGRGRPGAPIGAAQSIDVQVINRAGVPAAGVDSVVLNVTATNPTASSFVTVWPAGQPRPLASNLNVVPGQTVPNLVVAKVGVGGKVSIYNLAGSVDVVVDIAGYFPVGGSFVSLQPARLMETRPGEMVAPGATNKGTPLGQAQTFDLRVTGVVGVPSSGVSAVVLNVTAIRPSGPSFVTVWPAGVPRPNASNLNLKGGGEVVPNLVVARVGAGGKVSIFNLSGNTDLIVDVAGYFVEEATDLRDIVSNESSTCTLDRLGRSTCWGGTGFDDQSVYPMTVVPPGLVRGRPVPYSLSTYSDAVDLAIGDQHACMLRADLTVWCWATSTNRSLTGDGTVGYRWPPVQVPNLADIAEIDATNAYTCALRMDGTVWCWGDLPGRYSPSPLMIDGITKAVQISTGPSSACALQSDAQVVCWGEQGVTGVLGTIDGSDSPTVARPVAGLVDADSVKVQGLQACATRITGEAVCWGNGFLGGGSTGRSMTPVPVIDGVTGQPATDILYIAGGSDFRCALRFDDNVYCWGSSFSGTLGLAPPTASSTRVLSTVVEGLPPIAFFTANRSHMCAFSYDSDVYCWGVNSYGQLGNGTLLNQSTPTLVYSAWGS